MDSEEARVAIDEIPGDNGWWHVDDGDAFYDAAILLKAETDWSFDMIVDFLGGLYGAVANEFGG